MDRRRAWPALRVRFPHSPPPTPLPPLPDLLAAALTDFEVIAVEELSADHWRISFRDEDERGRAQHALAADFEHSGVDIVPIDLPDDDWVVRSQQSLGAVQVERIIVAPPWDIPRSTPEPSSWASPCKAGGDRDAIVVIIRPSMGFGTGHHATTRLCLRALQRLSLGGAEVLDVGTGSGVLAIAAARLGATHVLALDEDPDAIASARDNVRLNDVERTVTLQIADVRRLSLAASDVVTANLTGALLMRTAGWLTAAVKPGGHLIVSGLLTTEEKDVSAAFSSGAVVEARETEEEWVGLTLSRAS